MRKENTLRLTQIESLPTFSMDIEKMGAIKSQQKMIKWAGMREHRRALGKIQ